MIVVTAPTGNIGRHVVEGLLDAGEDVRVIVRDPGKLPPATRGRVEAIEGSHGDAAVVDRAFDGAEAVFWLAPVDPTRTLDEVYLDFTRPAAEAIRRRGVPRVVGITALGRGTRWQDHAGLVTGSIRMDDMLMATGAAFRGLAMPTFMDNFLPFADAIRDEGLVTGSIDGDREAPKTATRDMGAVAARLLADRGWSGQEEVAVIGPEDLSMNEMAAIMADVLGRAVRYEQVSDAAYRRSLLERGMSDAFADAYVEMMRAKDEGMDNEAAQSADGRTPTTFRAWCEAELKPKVHG